MPGLTPLLPASWSVRGGAGGGRDSGQSSVKPEEGGLAVIEKRQNEANSLWS